MKLRAADNPDPCSLCNMHRLKKKSEKDIARLHYLLTWFLRTHICICLWFWKNINALCVLKIMLKWNRTPATIREFESTIWLLAVPRYIFNSSCNYYSKTLVYLLHSLQCKHMPPRIFAYNWRIFQNRLDHCSCFGKQGSTFTKLLIMGLAITLSMLPILRFR